MTTVTRKRKSFRAAINEKCFSCIYDPAAAGTRRVQVTLCSCFDCPLWDLRPTTKSPIPESVLRYYQVQPDDPCLKSIVPPREGLNGHFSGQTPSTGRDAELQTGAVLGQQS